MKYLLAIYGDSSTWGTQSEEDAKAELDAFAAFEREAAEAGILVAREALQPDAHTLSVAGGAPHFTEGAPTERAARLGCFYLVDCDDLAEVREWAAKIPLVGDGGFHSIEIRRVMS